LKINHFSVRIYPTKYLYFKYFPAPWCNSYWRQATGWSSRNYFQTFKSRH